MSSTPNQYDESKWAPQRLSAALQHLRAYTLDQAAGTMQRQLSSWTQALQRFRIESSSTDEEVHSAPATWDEPDAAFPDLRTAEEIREMRLAASVAHIKMLAARLGSDHDEFVQTILEFYSETKTRDRLVFKARQLEEQGEFRAAELLNRRADTLSKQLTEKVAYSAELIGQSEAAEDVRAGRQPTSFYRSELERQYSVRRRPAPADPGQLAATASLLSTANTGGLAYRPWPRVLTPPGAGSYKREETTARSSFRSYPPPQTRIRDLLPLLPSLIVCCLSVSSGDVPFWVATARYAGSWYRF